MLRLSECRRELAFSMSSVSNIANGINLRLGDLHLKVAFRCLRYFIVSVCKVRNFYANNQIKMQKYAEKVQKVAKICVYCLIITE